VGIALWFVSAAAALLLAKMLPWKRPRTTTGEFLVSIAAGLLLGALATALDFGGWNEPDWRAALFVFLGALAAIGVFRLTIARPPGGPS
jgi:fluoride ion exporter CrcB/FEX